MRFRLLGPVTAEVDGRPVDLGSRKQRLVLSLLLVEVNRVVPIERLIELGWPDGAPPSARSVVQTHVYRLRTALSPVDIRTEGSGYALHTEPASVDVHRFRDLVDRARADGDDQTRIDRLTEALDLWRGPVLADTATPDQRDRLFGGLAEARLVAVADRVDARLRLGRPDQVLAELVDLVHAHPGQERLVAQLMVALHRCGRTADALAAYQRLRRHLADELGLEPGAAVRQVEAAILRADRTPPPPDDPTWAAVPEPPHALTRPRTPAHTPTPESPPGPTSPTAATRAPAPASPPSPDPTTAAAPVQAAAAVQAAAPVVAAVPAGPAAPAAVVVAPVPVGLVPAQLPAAVGGFAGRRAELARLDADLDRARAGGTVAICLIWGTAGVGKSSLAVRWAHQVAGRFPDGQLFVDLRGHDRDGVVVEPGDALRGLLEALGVTAARLPRDLQARAGLFRSLLAGRRMLIVLDDARDADQVRPLLPGAPGCAAVVTSRNQLTGLVAASAARAVALELPDDVDAAAILAARLGTERVAAEPAAVAAIVRGCARLPLALAVFAARAAARPGTALAELAGELTADRLGALGDADPGADLRATLSWSYRPLGPAAARLFRLLGLPAGADLGLAAAASLAGTAPEPTRLALAELTRTHLVSEVATGRYAFHDLLRAYAGELGLATDSGADRTAALTRLLDHYRYGAMVGEKVLQPYLTRPAPEVATGVVRYEPATTDEVMAWFTREHVNLVAAVRYAAATDHHQATVDLALALSSFLDRRGHWDDWVATTGAGLAAAKALDDRRGQGHLHRQLARAHLQLGDEESARSHLTAALSCYEAVGHLVGQANVHHNLADLAEHAGDPGAAREQAEAALALYVRAGHGVGQGRALNAVGWYSSLLGEYDTALATCAAALDRMRAHDDRYGQAEAWDTIGHAHRGLGRHAEAVDAYERSLALFRDFGDRYYEADTLTHLGDAHQAAGDLDAARSAWQAALVVLTDLGHDDAAAVRARLSPDDGAGERARA